MELNEYQNHASTTDRGHVQGFVDVNRLARLTLGLAGESGEVAEKIKKLLRGDYKVEDIGDDIKKELGDVLWYLAMIAKEFEIDLNDVAIQNINKLADRQNRNKICGSGDDR